MIIYFCRLCRDRTRLSDTDSDSGSGAARVPRGRGGCAGVRGGPFPVETLPDPFAYVSCSDDGLHGGATSAATGTAGGGRECAVCLGAVRDGEMVRQLPACMHVYHAECIDRWFAAHRTCPLCRSELRPSKATAGAPPADQWPV